MKTCIFRNCPPLSLTLGRLLISLQNYLESKKSFASNLFDKRLSMQVSRLIEMQTPLYLEGVSSLHPYFRTECQESETNAAKNLQSQSSF